MALDDLSRNSVVIVHNEGTVVKDLGPNPTYQGTTVNELNGWVKVQASKPASATATGVKGEMILVPGEGTHGALYIATDANTWKKIDLAAWS